MNQTAPFPQAGGLHQAPQAVPEAPPCPRSVGLVLRRLAGGVGGLLRLWRSRMRESRELGLLSDRELRDMGVSHYDAAQAARKPFWKA